MEIGLGPVQTIKRAEVSWPTTGVTQTINALKADRYYLVREGTPEAVELEVKSFPFAASPRESRSHSHHHPEASAH